MNLHILTFEIIHLQTIILHIFIHTTLFQNLTPIRTKIQLKHLILENKKN